MTNPIHPYCLFKTDVAMRRAKFLSPQCIEILNDMAAYCEDRKLPFIVTETVTTPEEDKALSRVSSTHRTGRAFDISIRQWPEPAIYAFDKHFSGIFLHVAAIGGKTGEPELIVRHDNGHGDHMHIQIAKVFAVDKPMG